MAYTSKWKNATCNTFSKINHLLGVYKDELTFRQILGIFSFHANKNLIFLQSIRPLRTNQSTPQQFISENKW